MTAKNPGLVSSYALVAGCLLLLTAATLGARGQSQERGQDRGSPPRDFRGNCTAAECHDQYGQKGVVHDPVATGDCQECHVLVSGEDHRFQALPATVELCASCHGDVTADLKFAHGAVTGGACLVCHDPHASGRPGLMAGDPTGICLRCHVTMKEWVGTRTYTHDPAVDDCLSCHDAHGGDNRMILLQAPPALCIECHVEIGDVVAEAAVSHDAVSTERSCVSCHEPHASDTEHLLLREPMDMCLTCHGQELDSGGKKIGDITLLLERNSNHHGPIREKNCTACHVDVHGSKRFRLLGEEYPAGFYAPYEERRYALCFQCHEPDVVRDGRTDALTDFRNGDRNLHFLHVNRQPKGRTCRACHETHASRNPRHIADAVPFGESDWMIPINYRKSDTGGSCLPGCHKQYGYDRITPVVNIVK
ncbi:MAG: cytochrome c3 family protein [Planctomycetota bacterium]